MTTWLEFRSEPLTDVPEVKLVRPANGEQPYVECQSLGCNFIEGVTNPIEAQSVIAQHEQWHEDGMPD